MFKHPKSIFAEPQSTACNPAGNRQVVIFHRQVGLTFRTIFWWYTATYFCYPDYIGGVLLLCAKHTEVMFQKRGARRESNNAELMLTSIPLICTL